MQVLILHFFPGTSIFQKVPYEALALPSLTVELPSTINHQPNFYITAIDCGILFCPYLSIRVVLYDLVAQILDKAIFYQQ